MVIESNDGVYQTQLSDNKKVVVKFFASWCGSCKLFAPKYKRLSEDERFADIAFLNVNAEENPHFRKESGVNNLPSFAIFQDGKFVETISTSKEEMFVEFLGKLNNEKLEN
jgi:thioredoxin 1